jgi:ornithine cyclodeaminase/alanine dehydrogenase-like protein (mu-crystallin family)/gentisate 1,2-dioxygenase
MNAESLTWLQEKDVVDLVDLNEAIEALERGLRWEGEGGAVNVPKALGTWADGSSMHALGSVFTERGYCGWKAWANTKRGATAVFVLFDAQNGKLLSVMEAASLGQMRTSAISGLATRWLSVDDADEMALIGTGAQSLTQVAAVSVVRSLRRLKVFSPNKENRDAFVAKASALFDFEVVASESVEQAVADVPIVTTITRSDEPFLTADMLASGTHLNAVGAILPMKSEFAQDVFERADMVVGDYLPNLQRASKEFIEYFEKGPGEWSDVKLLGKLIANNVRRPNGADLTLFKAMGMGISDLSVAILAHERAAAQNVGITLPQPQRVEPRWSAMAIACPAQYRFCCPLDLSKGYLKMSELKVRFEEVGSVPARDMNFWPAVVIPKEDIDREIERLSDMDRPANSRRISSIIHPCATGAGQGLAPGIDATINVLLPGEETVQIRRNSNQIGMCIEGSGEALIGTNTIRFEQFDVWNTPSMMLYRYRNTGNKRCVFLSYSNAPLLEKLEVHFVEEDPLILEPSTSANDKMAEIKRAREFADNFEIGEAGARLMGYEYLIDIDVVPSKPLIWQWNTVSSHLDRVANLGKDYRGRRLYLLYNPATERRNGTSHSFFATIARYPADTLDMPHRHSSAAINYYFEGLGKSTVEGQKFEWKAGDLMLSAPGWAIHNHGSRGNGFHALTIQDHPLHIAMESLIWQETLKDPVLKLGAEQGAQTNLGELAGAD